MSETVIGTWDYFNHGDATIKDTVAGLLSLDSNPVDAHAVLAAYTAAVEMALPQGIRLNAAGGTFCGRSGMSSEEQVEAELGIRQALASIDFDQVAQPHRTH